MLPVRWTVWPLHAVISRSIESFVTVVAAAESAGNASATTPRIARAKRRMEAPFIVGVGAHCRAHDGRHAYGHRAGTATIPRRGGRARQARGPEPVDSRLGR